MSLHLCLISQNYIVCLKLNSVLFFAPFFKIINQDTPFKDKTYTHTFAGYNLLDSPYLNMTLQLAEPSANIVAKIRHNVSHL